MSETDGQVTPPPRAAAPSRIAAAAGWAARIAGVALGLLCVTAGGLAVRLAHGPLDATRLIRHFVARDAGAQRLSFAAATLWWDWQGAGAPLVISLRDAVLRRADASIAASARTVTAGVLPGRLLVGRVRVVSAAAAQGSVALSRGPDGEIGLDQGAPPGAAGPVRPLPSRMWMLLRSVTLDGVELTLTDRASAAQWQARIAQIGLHALDTSAPTGNVDVTLGPANRTARLTAALSPGTAGARVVTGAWTAIDPAALGFAQLQPLDLPVAGGFRIELDAAWAPRQADLALAAGAGQLIAAGSALGVAGGSVRLALDAVAHRADITVTRLAFAGAGAPVAAGAATLTWAAGALNAALSVDVDRVGFAELARYWPAQAARDARAWVTGNITAGVASQLHADLAMTLANGAVTLTRATGHLQADDATLAWLRPVPPLTHVRATLTLQSPDALLVAIPAATQAASDAGSPPLLLSNASLRITGLAGAVQTGAIETDIAGPVTQALVLLSEPRLRLLARHKMDFGVPAGRLAAHLRLELPLESSVTMDQIPLHANGMLSDLHLGHVIAGKDLDQGRISLLADNDGLSLNGPALLAGIPSNVSVRMDFRAGGPDQVIASYTAQGSASAAQLQAAGFPSGGLVDGTIAYTAAVQERRDGSGTAQAHVDLRAAGLELTTLGWRKARDTDTAADASVRLLHDQLVGVDRLSVHGPDVDVQGRATYAAGQPVTLTFDRIELGQTRAAGTVRFASAGDPAVRADLHGDVLDLTSRVQPGPPPPTPNRMQAQAAARARRSAAAGAKVQRGRPWKADLRFAQVVLGPGHTLANVVAHAENDGLLVQRAQVSGVAGQGGFRMTLSPQGSSRRLAGDAKDAGGLLRALDLTGAVRGGEMHLVGAYDDTLPDHPLAGTVTAERIRVVGAPAVARLLQAVTLYGLVDVLRGPGLGITHLSAPFRFADSVLTLQDGARAFSSSLGVTAAGEIDLAAQRADLSGTIVPGYFFNTLPGKLPVLGKLFSPEQGGGVFSGTYKLAGPLAAPKVQVNPLAALTPGFLRGLFGGTPPVPSQ